MTAPKLARSTRNGRVYDAPEGVPGMVREDIPSASQTLGMIGGRWALEKYMKKAVAQASVDWAKSGKLTALLAESEQMTVDLLSKADEDARDAAGAIGNVAHAALEAWQRGEKLPVLVGPADDTVRRVIRLLEAAEWEPIWTEVTVFGGLDSPDTAYAGTADAFGHLTLPDGRRLLSVIDFKTGKTFRENAVYQLAAYRFADHAVLDDGSVHEVPRNVEGAFVIHARPDRAKLVPVDAGEAAFMAFRSARFLLAARKRKFIYPEVKIGEKH